jgi:sugar phosphate isomerase/epimerase
MKEFMFCLNTSTIRPAGLKEKIQIAADVGYDAIELWNDDMTAYEREGGNLADISKLLNDNNLSVATVIALHGWITSEGEEYRRAIETAKVRMRQAADVGSPYIIASPPREKVDDMAKAAKRYHDLLELGKSFGVKPAMEFLGFVEGINTINDAWDIVTNANHPDGTIVLDPFHIFRGGSDVNDMRKIPGDKIAVFHFNDAPGTPARELQTDADRVYPGDGILPLADMAQMLREAGYKGCISLELFNRGLWEQNPEEVARIGLEKMKAMVEG